jgi:hypothetical protein
MSAVVSIHRECVCFQPIFHTRRVLAQNSRQATALRSNLFYSDLESAYKIRYFSLCYHNSPDERCYVNTPKVCLLSAHIPHKRDYWPLPSDADATRNDWKHRQLLASQSHITTTVSQPVRLGVRCPSGNRNQFFFLLDILF